MAAEAPTPDLPRTVSLLFLLPAAVVASLAAAATPRNLPFLLLGALLGALFLLAVGRLGPRVDLSESRFPWAGAVAVVAALLAAPSLACDFLGDDLGWVHLFHDRPILEILTLHDISRGIWGLRLDELRPLFPLSFRLNAALFGVSPVGFHAVNVALHVGCTLAVFFLARGVTDRPLTAFAGAVLFASSPAHAETIAWVSGRVDSLPTLGYLSCLALFVYFRRTGNPGLYAAALASFVFGLFAKEILLTLPVVLVGVDLFSEKGRSQLRSSPLRLLLAHLPFVALAGGYLALRRFAFGNFAREGRFASVSAATILQGQAYNLGHLVPFPSSSLAVGLLIGVAALLGRTLLSRRRSLASVSFFGPFFYGVTMLPLLVTYPSPRHLYLPTAGLAIAFSLALFPLEDAAEVTLPRLGVWVVLCVSCAVFLEDSIAHWQRSSAISRGARTGIESLAPSIPEGSLVVLSGIPGEVGETIVWDFGLPFALQPPFLHEDVYDRFALLDSPAVYCCPVEQWWAEKRPILQKLLSGSDDETLQVYSLHWNSRRGRIVGTFGVFPRGELKRRFEAMHGHPNFLEDSSQAIPGILVLQDAVRQLASDPIQGGASE